MLVKELQEWGRKALFLSKREAYKLEADALLAFVLKLNKAFLVAHDTDELTNDAIAQYKEGIARLQKGEPFAYLIGQKEFYGINFKVSPDTLIPRPDTELIVDLTLDYINKYAYKSVLDLGTGTGAIIISICKNCKLTRAVALDKSSKALEIAKENGKENKVNIEFLQSDWFSALNNDTFDVIVSNPPYIKADDEHLKALTYEPISALVSEDNGLLDIKKIVRDAKIHLNKNGLLLIEHGYDQGKNVREIFISCGFCQVATIKDLHDCDRVTLGFNK